MMKQYKCTNIVWDIDNHPVVLPTSCICNIPECPEDELDEALSDCISDHYGWCVKQFDYEEVE